MVKTGRRHLSTKTHPFFHQCTFTDWQFPHSHSHLRQKWDPLSCDAHMNFKPIHIHLYFSKCIHTMNFLPSAAPALILLIRVKMEKNRLSATLFYNLCWLEIRLCIWKYLKYWHYWQCRCERKGFVTVSPSLSLTAHPSQQLGV